MTGDPSFYAYIDESGELGMNFDRKSSEFLVMGAAIVPAWFPDCASQFFQHARLLRNKPKSEIPKFQKCGESTRYLLAMMLAKYPIAAVQVAFHKPSLFGSGMARSPAKMYAFLIKLTLERISWYARDEHHPADPNSGKCQVIFSENTALPYDDIQAYLRKLRREPHHNSSIEWRFIHSEDPKPIPHCAETETHLADIVASSMYWAIDGTKRAHGYRDDRFFSTRRPGNMRRQSQLVRRKILPGKMPINHSGPRASRVSISAEIAKPAQRSTISERIKGGAGRVRRRRPSPFATAINISDSA